MPVFGKETTGSFTDPIINDRKWAVKYALPETGTVTKLTAYVCHNNTGGTVTAHWSVYDDDGGSGNPGTLLGTTDEHEITHAAPLVWEDFPFSAPLLLTPGDYWLSYNSSHTSLRFGVCGYDNVAAASRDNVDAYADGDSNPFGVGTPDIYEWAVYATYTVAQVDVLSMQAHVFGHGVW